MEDLGYDRSVFGRKKKGGLREYESARPEDKMVLAALIDAGAVLTEPRHVLHFVYELADEAAAIAAAAAVADWESSVNPPPEGYDTWTVTFEKPAYVLTPENVVADAELFLRTAEAHGGRYDGWEASV